MSDRQIHFDLHVLALVSCALVMLVAEAAYPELGRDFGFLVAGLLAGYLLVTIRDRHLSYRSE